MNVLFLLRAVAHGGGGCSIKGFRPLIFVLNVDRFVVKPHARLVLLSFPKVADSSFFLIFSHQLGLTFN